MFAVNHWDAYLTEQGTLHVELCGHETTQFYRYKTIEFDLSPEHAETLVSTVGYVLLNQKGKEVAPIYGKAERTTQEPARQTQYAPVSSVSGTNEQAS